MFNYGQQPLENHNYELADSILTKKMMFSNENLDVHPTGYMS